MAHGTATECGQRIAKEKQHEGQWCVAGQETEDRKHTEMAKAMTKGARAVVPRFSKHMTLRTLLPSLDKQRPGARCKTQNSPSHQAAGMGIKVKRASWSDAKRKEEIHVQRVVQLSNTDHTVFF